MPRSCANGSPRQGATFETHKGGSGHLTVLLHGKRAELPIHGRNQELGDALVHKIKKQLGLK